jgi:hypothetical protein
MHLPRLTFRLAFAGNRQLPEDTSICEKSLHDIFNHVAFTQYRIIQKSNDVSFVPQTKDAEVTLIANLESCSVLDYYSLEKPLLRLVTGLADGGDLLAHRVFDSCQWETVEKEMATVIGCDLKSYRGTIGEGARQSFDLYASQCTYVQCLDGNYVAGDPGKINRAKLYRAQAWMMLRQADLLIAMADTSALSKPGGTLETVKEALADGISVLFIHSETGKITFLPAGVDFFTSQVFVPYNTTADWRVDLQNFMLSTLADPKIEKADAALDNKPGHGYNLLEEYFHHWYFPAKRRKKKGDQSITTLCISWREKLYDKFESIFKKGSVKTDDKELPELKKYRDRAKNLSYHYSGNYRGAFLANYGFAVLAVLCAVTSLVLMGMPRHEAHHAENQVPDAITSQGHSSLVESDTSIHSTGVVACRIVGDKNPIQSDVSHDAHDLPEHTEIDKREVVILFLGLIKLAILIFIFRNVHQAKHNKWNEKAVDYRYLAERLRTLSYLARFGHFRSANLSSPQHSMSSVRQSKSDWLFNAIVRNYSPSLFAKEVLIDVGSNSEVKVNLVETDVKANLSLVKNNWVMGQIEYHRSKSVNMRNMYKKLSKLGERLNIGVIVLVALDLLLVVGILAHFFKGGAAHYLHFGIPVLVGLTAIVPALVASLNGVQFQSECQRLAERSAILAAFMGGVDKTGGRIADITALEERIEVFAKRKSDNIGCWDYDGTRLAELISTDFLHEVSEWSVLYSKVILEQ